MTEPVGSLGEEASRLFSAAEEWLRGVVGAEVVDHLAAAGASLLSAARAALDATQRADGARSATSPVEHIDVD